MAYFRAFLSPPAVPNRFAPHVYEAQVHVRLRLSHIARLMYWLRPGGFAAYLMALVGMAMAAGGTTGQQLPGRDTLGKGEMNVTADYL